MTDRSDSLIKELQALQRLKTFLKKSYAYIELVTG